MISIFRINHSDNMNTIINGKVDSCLYKKQLNLYLYLPPHSCHSPGVLKGLIAGMLYRILRLTTNKTLRQQQAQRLYNRLIARGYLPQMILPIFNTYIKKYFRKKPLLDYSKQPITSQRQHPIFLHLP